MKKGVVFVTRKFNPAPALRARNPEKGLENSSQHVNILADEYVMNLNTHFGV